MSFSSDVKSEIAKTEILSSCCLHAQVYGLVLFAHFSKYNLSITTENTDVFDLYCSYLKEYCKVNPVISGERHFEKDEHLLVLGKEEDVHKVTK